MVGDTKKSPGQYNLSQWTYCENKTLLFIASNFFDFNMKEILNIVAWFWLVALT